MFCPQQKFGAVRSPGPAGVHILSVLKHMVVTAKEGGRRCGTKQPGSGIVYDHPGGTFHWVGRSFGVVASAGEKAAGPVAWVCSRCDAGGQFRGSDSYGDGIFFCTAAARSSGGSSGRAFAGRDADWCSHGWDPAGGKTLWNSIAGQDADDRRRALHCGVVVGLALVAHNLPEGILTLFSGVQDPREGLRLSLAIALHNLPEGISTAAPIWYATHSRKKSVLAAFGSGLAEPLGALLAYFVPSPVLSPGLLAGLTLGAAGVMCWVSVSELLFGGFALGRRGDTAAGFAAGVCGMILGIAVLA